jgi:succinate dehydrogenase assembly factor 1
MVRSKPENTRHKFHLYVQYTFHQNAERISPRNVSAIEHLLRTGRRQVEMYEDPAVKDCWVSADMIAWKKEKNNAI